MRTFRDYTPAAIQVRAYRAVELLTAATSQARDRHNIDRARQLHNRAQRCVRLYNVAVHQMVGFYDPCQRKFYAPSCNERLH